MKIIIIILRVDLRDITEIETIANIVKIYHGYIKLILTLLSIKLSIKQLIILIVKKNM